jgi:hypothetical protein
MFRGSLRIVQLLAKPRDVHIHGPRIDLTVVLPAILRRRKAQSFRSDMVSLTLASARVVFAVWHADAASISSDESVENTTGQTFLRPPCPAGYRERIIHICVMIRTFSSSGSARTEFTTQLFFDQTLINAPTTSVSRNRSRAASHAEHSIYSSSTRLTLANAATGGGCAASITRRVQIT